MSPGYSFLTAFFYVSSIPAKPTFPIWVKEPPVPSDISGDWGSWQMVYPQVPSLLLLSGSPTHRQDIACVVVDTYIAVDSSQWLVQLSNSLALASAALSRLVAPICFPFPVFFDSGTCLFYFPRCIGSCFNRISSSTNFWFLYEYWTLQYTLPETEWTPNDGHVSLSNCMSWLQGMDNVIKRHIGLQCLFNVTNNFSTC